MQKVIIIEFDVIEQRFDKAELDNALEQGWKIISVTANPGACGGQAAWTPGTYLIVLEKE